MKTAFITGITGQDGIYLTRLLMDKNYTIHGLVRKLPNNELITMHPFLKNVKFYTGDITDTATVFKLIAEIQPDEIYNLAAMSHVKASFNNPLYTADADALGIVRILEAVKTLKLHQKTKIYQALSSELFGKCEFSPQNEKTPFNPQNPYAIAKLYSYWMSKNYRDAYGMFIANGILYNHESPIRGEDYVTRKITLSVAKIKHGIQDTIYLGNLDVMRDWGFAGDYVEAMWKMLQLEHPEDFVIATGIIHSVRQFVEQSFQQVGITIEWHGTGIKEIGIDKNTGTTLVKIDPQFFRPIDVDILVGDATKAERILDWTPKTAFSELIKIMVESDLQYIKKLK
ncbi:GDP-mannose 4,6-dehydratase [Lysinibacillus sp. PLM2]|nr:GDP-mannose 4,6-dehydratase [Lysinibacillus sp. PLM2]